MKAFRNFVIGALALAAGAVSAANLSLFTGPAGSNPTPSGSNVADLNAVILATNAGVTPQAMGTYTNFRNLLDNGAISVTQRGTTAATGGTTGAAVYVNADRWAVSTNVTSGAGFSQVVTATPSPLIGFQNSMKLYRNSGALLQPVCAMQEVPTADSVPLQGQPATFSVYLQALAGMAADNANAANLYIIYGTGSDEGLGTFTASPAITPAWTGINASITQAVTLTTSWARYTVSGNIPTTAKEVGVMVCFTPVAGSGGSTDGLAIVGAQLEQGSAASSFEYRPLGVELAKAQRYYWQIADGAATVPYPSSCFVTAANTTVKCGVNLPVIMRSVPATTVSVATSFGIVVTAGTAGTCTTLAATASSNTTQSIGVTCTTGGTIALGSATPLIGAATAGVLSASSDF